MIYITAGQAFEKLGIKNWTLQGEPNNEAEFLQYFYKQVGIDPSNGHAIMSNNPSDFGITWNEIAIVKQQLQDEYIAKEYQRNRAKEYPSFAEQFDTLYHGGYDAWKATIDSVKAKYPKP